MTLIDKIRELVAEGHTEKSIEELLGYVKENHNEVIDQLILLKGRMKMLNKSIVEGIIDNDMASIERARINEAILRILNEITPSFLRTEEPVSKMDHNTVPKRQSPKSVFIVGVIILVIAILFYYSSKKPEPIVKTVQNIEQQNVLLQTPVAEYDGLKNNAYWIKIRLPGRIIQSRGMTGQLKAYFTFNGQLLVPTAQEVTYRDPNFNCVAIFSPSFYIDSDDYILDNIIMSIPYSSLNMYYTGGKVSYNLQFFVEVWMNGNKVKISPYQAFTFNW